MRLLAGVGAPRSALVSCRSMEALPLWVVAVAMAGTPLVGAKVLPLAPRSPLRADRWLVVRRCGSGGGLLRAGGSSPTRR